ncbi:MAG: SH3 domain-containing protein [Clostridia bacterium]
MTVKIGHAVQDENGGIDGAIAGDQTGKEIATRNWYNRSGGWGVRLTCIDREMANKAARFVEQVCDNPSYGYSQRNRWSGYRSIVANNGVILGAKGDFDCATLCISAYIMAGLDHKASGYTGNIERSFVATGKFIAHKDTANLTSPDYAKRGDLYLMAGKHVAMLLTDGPKTESSPTSVPGSEADDVDPPYVLVIGGTVNVRAGSSTHTKILFTAKRGIRLPYIETDADTGWYMVQTYKGDACISGNPKYTRLVTGNA